MSEHDSNWKYADDIVTESEVIQKARQQSLELGLESISPAIGAQVALIAAISQAQNIVEFGTGAGVSGLWLLSSSPRSVLTSIDHEAEHLGYARKNFLEAGIPANRVRLITGKTSDVLPRMNENSYDVVLIDADPTQLIENVEHGLRLAKAGGIVLVPHALWKGRVSDPAQRDQTTSAFRTLAQEIASSSAVISALTPVGDGLLQISTTE